ncbi:MAG: arylsulfatase [Acidithiobacillales bacterium SM23_46]|nr:MAG: arylsulfatase [Acidithiobacillales bacterium SM23_46]
MSLSATAFAADKPNIVLIYTDDVGYGDVSCYGATKVKTPNIDRLAERGLRFTDGHSPAATCTPSRYALLTGEYAWRRKGTGIARGDAALIIKPGRPTLPLMLKKAGYSTGVVGKWHLGLGSDDINWNGDIKPGPLEIGFDYAFLIPATGDRTPCVYVENHRVVGLDPADPIQVGYGEKIGNDPTGRENPELLKMKPSHGHDQTIVNGISRIGYMSGGKAARWVDEDMADTITRKAVAFIERYKEKPFFLYFSTHDIHVPRVPHARFVGKSDCGTRGDVIVQMDWCVGEIVAALERFKLLENTLLIFTSDNGPVYDDGYQDGAVEDRNGHEAAGPFRGGKYSNFEAGTRVPFIVHWPARVKPGISDALVGQIDLFASLATLTSQKLAPDAAPDSFNVLPALLGESKRDRDHLVEQARVQSLRKGAWKLIPAGKGPAVLANTAIESGSAPEGRLFNLADDIGEQTNVAAQHPEILKELVALLEKLQTEGRSRPQK